MAQMKDNMFVFGGKKTYLVGVNYLPSEYGHSAEFWRNFDPEIPRRDFRIIKDMGLSIIRLPLPISMVADDGEIDKVIFASIQKAMDLAFEAGLMVVPNFFHGGYFTVKWVTPDTAFSSPEVLELESKALRAMAKLYGKDERVLAWDVCNEPWWMFGLAWHPNRAKMRGQCSDWIRKITDAMRAAGITQPVTLGVDHAGVVQEVGADVDALSKCVDFTSPHFYSRYIIGEILVDEVNSLRDTYYGTFIQRRATPRGAASSGFEFGNSTQFVEEVRHGRQMRTLLWSALINGACAFAPWNYQDFAPGTYPEYAHQPHECTFGMLRADGSKKPAALELEAFSRAVKLLEADDHRIEQPNVGIYTAGWYGDREYMTKAAFNAFCLAKQAGMNVEFVQAGDDLAPYKAMIVLSNHFSYEDAAKWTAYVEAGGVLLVSPTAANLNSSLMQDVFGVTMDEAAWMGTGIRCRVERGWHGLAAGQEMAFASHKLDGRFRYVMTPRTAEVVMTDERGLPALTCNKYGRGYALHNSFPLEYAMSIMICSHQTIPAWRIYRGMRELAGITRAVEADHPYIETGVFEGARSVIGVFLNHENTDVTAPLRTSFPCREIVDVLNDKPFDGGNPNGPSLRLGPSCVAVLKFVK